MSQRLLEIGAEGFDFDEITLRLARAMSVLQPGQPSTNLAEVWATLGDRIRAVAEELHDIELALYRVAAAAEVESRGFGEWLDQVDPGKDPPDARPVGDVVADLRRHAGL